MSKERVLLLHHPDVYEETKKKLKINPEATGGDTSFEEWDDLFYNTDYMFNPVRTMIEQLKYKSASDDTIVFNPEWLFKVLSQTGIEE